MICSSCYKPKKVSDFPSCKELREALAKGQENPAVACKLCQDIKQRPSSLEYQELVQQAWLRGENVG